MQQLIPLIKDLSDIFTTLELPCAFGGALANNYWGIVRTTQDVDCLISIPLLKYQRLADELNNIGCEVVGESGRLEPLDAARMRENVIQRKLIECFRHSIRAELFVPVVPLQDEILRRAVTLPLDDAQIRVTTAEDIILLKLAFHRDKDLTDVRGILWVQRGSLDLEYLQHWSARSLEDAVQAELQVLIDQYAREGEESS